MKNAIQLYSIKETCENNLNFALKTMSELGYEAVEFASFFNYTADQINEMLKRYNLKVAGAHIDEKQIFEDIDATISYQKAIGNKRIICPWSDLNSKEDVINFVEKIKAVAPKYNENGLKLYYHNHSHEFKMDNGQYLLDMLYELTTPDELWFELDLYWVFRGGANPIYYLKKYKNRMDIFHAKDGTSSKGTPVGDGVLPYDEILNKARKYEMKYVVAECESATTQDSELYDAKISANYLIKNAKKAKENN
ncbi:MAG: sugar phosphate isomerase/epimerase [Oscillospiraceae bacterium]